MPTGIIDCNGGAAQGENGAAGEDDVQIARGRGRPRTDTPSDKTLQNRAAAERRERRAAANIIGAQLPERLRFDLLEETDVERIYHWRADDLARFDSRGGELLFCDSRGVWRIAGDWNSRGGEYRRFVNDAIAHTRALALREIAGGADGGLIGADVELYATAFGAIRCDSNRHNNAVGESVINHSHAAARVGERSEHRYVENPMIPLADGGGWDVVNARRVGREDMRALHITRLDWAMPSPDLTAWDAPANDVQTAVKRILIERYGAGERGGFFDRMALTLLGPDKRIELVKAATANFGKSTFFETLQIAFGREMVHIELEKAVANIGGRFSTAVGALTTALWVVLDEVDKAGAITAGALNALTNETIPYEKKHVDAQRAARTATLWLVGNDWAEIDTGATGIDKRIDWAWDFGAGGALMADEMPDTDARAMRHEGAGAVLQAALLIRAAELAGGASGAAADGLNPLARAIPATRGERSNRALDDFMASGLPPAHRALADSFAAADGGFVTSGEITATLRAAGMDAREIPKTSAMRALVNRIAPNAKPARRMDGGARLSGWSGLRRIYEYDYEGEGADD